MTFVFPLLLGGLVLAGIPVLLHLIVRQQPKRLPFPAFRFLVQQQRSNLRKLRLRHLLLLMLRVFLIAGMCMLLARPRLFHRALGLDSERPVQAVLLFDTSASMEYKSSDGKSRLEDAQQRARELLDNLAAGSQVAIVDSADVRADQPLEWQSLIAARQRINDLKIRYANAPLPAGLLQVLARLDQAESDKSGRTGPPRMRLLAILSDRTRGSWDGGQMPALVDKLDRLTPMYEGLIEARGQVGALSDALRQVREKLPPASGKDYNEQSLLEALVAMQGDLAGLAPEAERWPTGLPASVRQVRRLSRDLLAQIGPAEPSPGDTASEFRVKVRALLSDMLKATSGVQLAFIDVGMESPVDLSLVGIELPQNAQGLKQVFPEGEPFTLQAVVRATGKDAPAQVVCRVGEGRLESKVEVKAGGVLSVPFRIGEAPLLLRPGDNPIEVEVTVDREPLPHSVRRFATVRVQPRRKVLLVVDDPERLGAVARKLENLNYAVTTKTVREFNRDALAGVSAVYLLAIAAPEANVWTLLAEYVRGGGGVGVVPAGNDMKIEAYTQPAALALLPATIERKVERSKGGVAWDWQSGKYAHGFMKRFQAWLAIPNIDFIRIPRLATAYWDVKPSPDKSLVLVKYTDGKPAVLDRLFDADMAGKALLFTTPLGVPQPEWNNYLEDVADFELALLYQATAYLAGESVPPQLNFTLGRGDPVLAMSGPALAAQAMLLRGREPVGPVTLEAGAPLLSIRDLRLPGNYTLDGKTKEKGEVYRMGFSVNVPAEECDLTRLPAGEFGPFGDVLLAMDRQTSLTDALRMYRSEPLDLMPYFMLALLLALAFENLLANKFYRRAKNDV
jgi:hypothetical protein